MKRLILLLSLLASTAVAQLSDVDQQASHVQNLLRGQNPGFESGVARWTASGGTFSTTTTNGVGQRSGGWTPSAASQTLTSNPVTPSRSLTLGPCLAAFRYQWISGTAGDIQVKIRDGSANDLITAVDLTPTTGNKWNKFEAGFICPATSTTVSFRLESTASTGAILLDEFHLGTDYRVGAASPTVENWTSYSRPGDWNNLTTTEVYSFYEHTGKTLSIRLAFTSDGAGSGGAIELPASSWLPTGYTYDSTKYGSDRIMCGQGHADDASQGSTADQNGATVYFTGDTGLITVIDTDGGDDIWDDSSPFTWAASDAAGIRCADLPVQEGNTSDQTVTLETQGWYVSSYLDSANPSLGTTDNSGTFFRVANSGLEMVNNSGSEPVEIPCEAPTPPEGLTCNTAAVDENVGIAFTIPKAGSYAVRFKYSQSQNASGGTIASYVKLAETSTTSNTILQEPSKASVYETDQIHTHGVFISGIFNFSTAGKKVIRLFESTAISGSPTTNTMRCDGFTDRHCYWEVYPITQNVQQAVALTGTEVSSGGWVDISSEWSTTPTGWSVTYARGKATVDDQGQWIAEIIVNATVTSTSASLSSTLDGVSPSTTVQALSTYSNAGAVAQSCSIDNSGVVVCVATGARTGFMVSGRFLVDSKPTWAP